MNKVSTAVQLRFDVTASNSIPNGVKLKLRKVAGKRMTKDGIIVLTVRNSRSQSSNRSAALQRLLELIRSATIENRPRYPTKPSILAKKKRVESKKKRGQLKRLRSKVLNPD